MAGASTKRDGQAPTKAQDGRRLDLLSDIARRSRAPAPSWCAALAADPGVPGAKPPNHLVFRARNPKPPAAGHRDCYLPICVALPDLV